MKGKKIVKKGMPLRKGGILWAVWLVVLGLMVSALSAGCVPNKPAATSSTGQEAASPAKEP